MYRLPCVLESHSTDQTSRPTEKEWQEAPEAVARLTSR